jgi:Flp pilus assembly protein CpaB
MKGIQGLIVAVGLGVVAAIFNWAYLAARSHDVEKVGFIGIDPKVTVISRGELLREEHLVEIGIPKQSVGKLAEFGVPYSAKETVIGQPVWRALSGGMLLLAEDLKTSPQELRLGDDEKAMWIPVETRAFVPSLVTPGDLVSFIVTRNQAAPTPAVPGAVRQSGLPPGPLTIIGPFKILSLGNRLGSAEVMRAARIPQVQEQVMTVAVKIANGQLDTKAQELWNALQATDFRQVGVLLYEHRINKS